MPAMSSKVVPIREEFETLSAMMHCFANDANIESFVGVLLLRDGTYQPVSFGADAADVALAAAVLSRASTEE